MLIDVSQGAVETVCREIREGLQFPADWWETRYSDEEEGEREQASASGRWWESEEKETQAKQ